LAYSAVSVLRQQIKPDHRVHGIVAPSKDWAANTVIPDYAAMHWYTRAPSAAECAVLRERVKACLTAAATSTGCKVKIDDSVPPLFDIRQNTALARNYAHLAKDLYGWKVTDVGGAIGGSTDFGNVTYALPSIHPSFTIPTKPNGGNHTALFTEAAGTEAAHEATLIAIKSLAHTGFRVIDDEVFFDDVKGAFEKGAATA